ncbi:DUF1566 domain-containing protein [Azotobacter vinelandii]|uniref:DUF1566 domain-containing protein n=1 Tax=Azotobacter vinelandii TaxID=354 RepID=UPI0009142A1A|nr:DUF1566 domain-containing protein [Azotobacter vinelandii]SFY34431.1 hypothetical protein SAMN04244547_05203 [Azotobacter vinelandii]
MTTINLKIDSTQAERILARALERFLEQPARPAQAADSAVAVSDIPPLGEYWPGEGGHNAGLVRGENGARNYYLIVPSGPAAEFKAAWGGYGSKTTGASSASDGLANTQALLADNEEHPAASFAAGFTADRHSDFYLPSRRELQVAEANVPKLFGAGWHWSSTQSSACTAYGVSFSDGYQYYGAKTDEARVRPVRRKFL